MLPNLSAPIDRNPKALQNVEYRGPDQAFSGTVDASGLPCTLCKMGCSALSGIAQQLCLSACDITVC